MLEISRLENAADNFDVETGIFREPIKYFDIYRERPVRLTVRALVPVKEHPKVNFNFINISCFELLVKWNIGSN